MNQIYLITVMNCLEQDELGWPYFGDTRCVGWLASFEEANTAVQLNYGDLWEGSYNYAVVEESQSGLYCASERRQFYKFNDEIKKYEPIEEPIWMKHFVNLSVG